MKSSVLFLTALLASPLSHAAAVSVPFTTNFDSYTAGSDTSALFEEANNGNGNSTFVDLGSGDIALRHAMAAATGTNNTATGLTTSVATIVSGGGFEFVTTFTLNSFTVGSSGIINTSLNALATSSSLGTGYRLNYTLSDGGSLVINQSGGTSGFSNIVVASNLTPVAGRTYTMTFRGIYTSATAINLFGSITDGTNTVSTSISDSSIPASSDNYFGVRTAMGNSTTNSSVQITTTAMSLIAVPEPASIILAALSSGAFVFRRRRL